MATYNLNINGKMQTVEAESDTPMLWVLRDVIGLVGTKYGCGIAQCGACTIHIDGQAMRSCQLPVSAMESKKITTISLTPSLLEILLENIKSNKLDFKSNKIERIISGGEKLNINQKTVNTYITRIMKKLEVNSKTYLYLLARKHIKQPY